MKRSGQMAVLWLALCAGTAWAQPAPADAGAATATPAAVKYLSGGAGDEERSQLMVQWPQYPLLIVFSAAGGAYAVADSVRITNTQGAVLLEVPQAGPLLMVNLPPGEYRLQARVGDAAPQERNVRLDTQPQRLDWRI
ncbi:hypothetical protein [Azohydromonas caseinilytica]|uniref:Carboxypeptidase regulatory-like domain-containing protein n=1 Tax=Azohydromonas caseinilytica TaxID=2728836 RepID=A0A848F722_9BURK|nr:hypothetical protein [Azohydromonas caseinilytica]NML13871.1 hypothetical protein [Azohydromonas caseinilytica]